MINYLLRHLDLLIVLNFVITVLGMDFTCIVLLFFRNSKILPIPKRQNDWSKYDVIYGYICLRAISFIIIIIILIFLYITQNK